MKKIFFTLATSLLFVANSLAQNSFAAFAALEHNGALTTFSGSNALTEAIKAADDGDVITLSAGSFAVDDIYVNKSITLRGAGIDVNNGENHTVIVYNGNAYGVLRLDYQTNPNMSVTFEGIDFQSGIYGNGAGENGQININKCIMGQACQAYAKNVMINSSKIYNLDTNGASSVKCYNSVISRAYTYYGTTYTNCVVFYGGQGTYENCICAYTNGEYGNGNGVLRNCVADHCVYVDLSNNFTPSSLNTDITVVENWSDVFNYEGENDAFDIDNIDFIRMQKFETKQKYSLMGIYAGLMPYSPVLDLPGIKSITVAKESDSDGKLSIDVEIED